MSMIAGTARSMGIEGSRLDMPEWEESINPIFTTGGRISMKHGKKYVESAKLIDRSQAVRYR